MLKRICNVYIYIFQLLIIVCFRHQLTKKPLSDMLKAELTMQKLLIIGNHFV